MYMYMYLHRYLEGILFNTGLKIQKNHDITAQAGQDGRFSVITSSKLICTSKQGTIKELDSCS